MWITEVYLWGIALALVGGCIVALFLWLRSKNIETKWYDWLVGFLGLLLLLFTIQNFYTSFEELEPTAAWMFVLITGIPSLVLLAIPVFRVWRRKQAAA